VENSATQTIATFTGTLLRREHALGQKFVQLIFREDGQDWLCVSTDPTTAKLPVGQNYRVEGVFKTHGERTYIHEPAIVLMKKGWLLWQRISFAVVVLMGMVIAGGVFMMHQNHSAQLLTPDNAAQTTKQNAPTVPSEDTAQTDQSTPDTTANTPAATTPAPVTTTKPKTTTPPVVTPPAVSATPPAPADNTGDTTPPPADTTGGGTGDTSGTGDTGTQTPPDPNPTPNPDPGTTPPTDGSTP